ncbi:MAG: aldo/keto reductase [Planctomycetota bacterium]
MELWFGCMPFGSRVDDTLAQQMLRRCLDAGITRFDTADAYNAGKSEEMLGRAIRALGIRPDDIIVSTKVGARYGAAPPDSGLSRKWIAASIDGSLQRLGLDRVDTYFMHQPDPTTPIDESLAAFADVFAAGKAARFGVSNFAAWQVMEMVAAGHTPALAQQMWNVMTRNLEQEWVPFARKYRIVTLAYNQLAGGLLTGKHDGGSEPAAGTRFDGNEMYRRRFWHPALFDAVTRLEQIAQAAGRTLLELALQWIAQTADGLLLGATSMPQLEANLAALQAGPLGADVLLECDAVWTDLRGPVPPYNR